MEKVNVQKAQNTEGVPKRRADTTKM